jgi:hypothetical protein
MKTLHFFTQPYPFFHKGKRLFQTTILVFVIGFLFEYLLIPFERNPAEHRFNYFIITLFHVGVACSIYFLFFMIVSRFVQEDNWKLYKEIFVLFVLLTLIGVGEWLIRDIIYDNDQNHNLGLLLDEMLHAYLSGTVIIIIVFSFIFNVLKRQNINSAQAFKLEKKYVSDIGPVQIIAQIPSDNFSLNPSNLVCALADGNYVEFYVLDGEQLKKEVKRITLSNAYDQLKRYEFIQKTHRAYLVNLKFLETVEGNTQGYQLTVKHLEFTVPVSRNHLQHFNQAMR